MNAEAARREVDRRLGLITMAGTPAEMIARLAQFTRWAGERQQRTDLAVTHLMWRIREALETLGEYECAAYLPNGLDGEDTHLFRLAKYTLPQHGEDDFHAALLDELANSDPHPEILFGAVILTLALPSSARTRRTPPDAQVGATS